MLPVTLVILTSICILFSVGEVCVTNPN